MSIFSGVPWERKESRWWVLQVGRDIVGVVTVGGLAIEVIEKGFTGVE